LCGSHLPELRVILQRQDLQLATLANNRLFEALSLLPAMHIFLAVWRSVPFRPLAFTIVAGQSALLAFVISCRNTAMWQMAMIVAVALGATLVAIWAGRRSSTPSRMLRGRKLRWNVGWPAAVAVVLLAMYMTTVDHFASSKYETEPKHHVIWHEVLRGLLAYNLDLQRIYLGNTPGLGMDLDQISFDAVAHDLTERNDASSPIAYVVDGRVLINVARGNADYERLARSLSLRIIAAHPVDVIDGLFLKFAEQTAEFEASPWSDMAGALLLAAFGGLLWLAAGGWETPNDALRSGAFATLVVLAFAAISPAIAPSALSVGTLLAFLIAGTIAIFALVILAKRTIGKIKMTTSSANDMTSSM
jgi:hypothetical protein